MGAIDCWSAAPLLGAEPIFSGEEADRIMERTMPFLKDFLRNLAILAVVGLALFILWPNVMGSVVQLYGTVLGPVAIVVLVVIALPRKRTRRD